MAAMEIRALSDVYAVSPQIMPEDVSAIAAAGFRTIICNRPDDEVVPGMRAADIRFAAESSGLGFLHLPLSQGDRFWHDLSRQSEAVATLHAPVLAYCASGTRSTVAWMCIAARTMPVDDLLAAANRAGYPLAAMRPQLEAIARA